MKINEHEAILTPRILLVPYSAHHVPTYHDWMKDEEIQKATASEPLTLDEEHAMQQSWRLDHDKLTFIVCHAPSASTEAGEVDVITPQKEDAPSAMIGDVNLFLYPDDADDEAPDSEMHGRVPVVGELEIMIAVSAARGKGLAYETLQAFMSYISSELEGLLEEYRAGSDEKSERYLRHLRVKIDQENAKSIGLFGKAGFERVGEGANYFGEVEMRLGAEKLGREEVGKRVRYGS